MRGNEMYVLGSGIDIGGRHLIPVIRILSITSRQLAFATVGPVGILVRDEGEKFRIALEDRFAWEKIGEVIPEVNGYRDLEMKSGDAEDGEEALPDLAEHSAPERPDYI
jgi:hypothetical protein